MDTKATGKRHVYRCGEYSGFVAAAIAGSDPVRYGVWRARRNEDGSWTSYSMADWHWEMGLAKRYAAELAASECEPEYR